MTLLFVDGFDHYTTNADLAKKYNSVTATYPDLSIGGGRRGGNAIRGAGSWTYQAIKNVTQNTTVIVGFAIKLPTSSSGDIIYFGEVAAGIFHTALVFNGTYLYVNRWGSVNLGTGTHALSANTWYYIEVKMTIGDTTGGFEVRVNGATDITASNIDTRNGGSGYIDRVALDGAIYNALMDDFYVCDLNGTTNNNFLGDCRVDTLMPTGDGNYSQFTPSTGTTHYTLVDEIPPNTTDYVSSATSGDRDSYTFPALANLISPAVHGVQINAAALKSDSGARSLGTMSRLSGTNKDGAGAAMNTSQVYISEIQETDPSSAAWTVTNVNAAEFGVKVTA